MTGSFVKPVFMFESWRERGSSVIMAGSFFNPVFMFDPMLSISSSGAIDAFRIFMLCSIAFASLIISTSTSG